MSEVLKNRLGCTVVGVEIDRDAAALAEQHTERVIVGDAEKIDYAPSSQARSSTSSSSRTSSST